MLRERRTPRRKPSQGRSRETVDAIIEATRRLVQSSGLGAVRMREVARVAGVSAGTLYQYFATPEALLAAWEEREFSRHGAAVGACLVKLLEAPPPWEESIYEVSRLALRLMREHVALYRGDELHDFLSRLQDRAPILEQVVAIVTGAMGNATERERLRFESPEVSAHLAVRTVAFLGYDLARMDLAPEKRDALEDAIARMVAHGVVRDRNPEFVPRPLTPATD